MKISTKNRLLLLAIILILMVNCGGPRIPAPGEPGSAELFEMAWVHPRVIISEPQFTLITAERVDSFLVARGSTIESSAPKLVFEVTGSEDCQITIELIEAFGAYPRPLISRSFSPGIYKISLNMNRFTPEDLPEGRYHLIAKTCQREFKTTFFRN